MSFVNEHEHETTPESIQFKNIDLSDPKVVDQKANRLRRSPVMVEFTDPQITTVDITRAMEAGLNIIKFRMAYSTRAQKVHLLSTLNKAVLRCIDKSGGMGYTFPVATCAALKTWVKKSGIIDANEVDTDYIEIVKDSEVILTCDHSFLDKCVPSKIFVDHDHLATDIHVGMEIIMANGDIVMNCLEKIDDKSIKCLVCKGGKLKNLETVYVRNLKPSTPYISQSDINILKFCVRFQIDMIIIYYARDGNMINKIKHILSKCEIKPLIYSAICHQDGLNNIDDIIKASDGIIFAREFLLHELDKSKTYRLAQLQKWVAGKCQQAGIPLFISTVFENLIAHGEVSGAEIADVTNALMDGVNGFMLRHCADITNTLSGINALNDVCCQVEPLTFDKNIFWRMLKEDGRGTWVLYTTGKYLIPTGKSRYKAGDAAGRKASLKYKETHFLHMPKLPVNAAEAAAISCVAVANQTKARVIIIPTVTGRTVKALLWLRPSCIVISVCTKGHIARLLYTCRNIVPLMFKGNVKNNWFEAEDSRILFAAQYAVTKNWMVYGDQYVSLQRSCEAHLFCDMVRVWSVTFAKKALIECEDSEDQAEGTVFDRSSKSVLNVTTKKKKKKKRKEAVPGLLDDDKDKEPKEN